MTELLRLLIALICIPVVGAVQQAQDAVLPQAQMETDSAAAAAEALRQTDGTVYDVTGNGVVDESDAIALLLHGTGRLDDLSALPNLLADSLLGEKYLDRFSYTGIVRGEGYYRSETLSYRLTRVSEEDLNYYVAEIFLRDLGHLRTAFANGRYQSVGKVPKMAQENNAIVAINGDFYAWGGKTGLVIRNGTVYRESRNKNKDICVLYADGVMETYAPSEVDTEAIKARGAYQSWMFGPSLFDETGAPKTKKSQFLSKVTTANPRTAIGYVEPGHYFFVTVDGRGRGGSDGMTMAELAKLMHDLGCTVAYNLDGGGTAIMVDQDGTVSRQSNKARGCSDIVFIVEDYAALEADN